MSFMSTVPATLPWANRAQSVPSRLRLAGIRFSLRELSLLMLACAAFSGWGHVVYRKSQPFRPTHVADYFVHELPQDVAAVRKSLGEQGAAGSVASSMDRKQLEATIERKDRIRLDWSCDLRLPWEKAYRLRYELTRRMIARIKQEPPSAVADMTPQTDEKYLGQRTIGMAGDYYEDEFQYRNGDTYGELRICLIGVNGKPPRLMATLHEWRPR